MHKKEKKEVAILAIVIVSVVIVVIAVVSTTAYIAKSKMETLNNKHKKKHIDIIKKPDGKTKVVVTVEGESDRSIHPMYVDQKSSIAKKEKYAFVFVGCLDSWEECIPKWRSVFAAVAPDIYLYLSSDTKLPQEVLQGVFGPDVKIKGIEYWNKNNVRNFETTMREKFIKIKENGIVQDPKGTAPLPLAQLQEVFRKKDFTKDYDIVVKMRMDSVPKSNWPVDMKLPFGEEKQIESSLFMVPDTLSFDGVYWSTSENMQKLHQDVFDRYGDYIDEKQNSWTSESHIISHSKQLEIEPLIVSKSMTLI